MIELVHVNAGYGEVIKLYDINLQIQQGTIIAVIGPNGSGKSTLLKTILGMTTRKSGQVLIEGKEQKAYEKEELARIIGFLPQTRNVPSITVERMILHGRFPYLSYPRRYSNRDYEIVKKAMEDYELLELKEKQLQELSGGERQKVYLAMAKVQDSAYYLFDEPTTYLDIAHQLEFLMQIRRLKEQGKTCVVVLHDLEAALKLADELILLNRGVVAFQGDAKSLLKQEVIDRIFRVNVRCLTDITGEQWYHMESANK